MKNIFVLGLNEFNRRMLERVRGAATYRFHELLTTEQLLQPDHYEFDNLLGSAEEQLVNFDGNVDSIIGYYDFPVSDMVPILRKRRGLPTPSIESVVCCEHKYWSRWVQKEAIPDHTPRFQLIDPRDEQAGDKLELEYPFWLKPVKSFSSYLGFRIDNRQDFEKATAQMRENLWRLAEPFSVLLKHVEMPREIAHVDGNYAIAEEMISGRQQCTIEGYVFNGKTTVYGTVDSIRGMKDAPSSFTAYRYPSELPRDVQDRMTDIAEKVMKQLRYDNGCFNIEFFYDDERDKLSLLEINPRLSKSHAPLFEFVDGSSHQEIAIHITLGKRPRFAPHRGPYNCAAKFMLRRREDAFVQHVPSRQEIEEVQAKIPGVMVEPEVAAGKKLSDNWEQDSYTYEYCTLFVGGATHDELEQKRGNVEELLPFHFEPV